MFFDVNNKYGKVRYFANDEFMSDCKTYQILFEQEYVEKYLLPIILKSKYIFDIGAHVGSHTIMYKKINKNCCVYSFEPQKAIYDLLRFNIKNNQLDYTYSHNLAVGNKNDIVEMTPYSTDGTNAMNQIEYGTEKIFNLAGVQIGHGGEQVTMIKLDTYMSKKCDFIKIDVEGYEPHVLLGAKEIINTCRPIISFEHNHKVSEDCEIETFDVLEMYNYKYKKVWNDNWIAVPDGKGE